MYFEKLKNQNILITRMKIKNIYNFSNKIKIKITNEFDLSLCRTIPQE